MHCPYCGSSVPNGIRSCPKCGSGMARVNKRVSAFSNRQSDTPTYYNQIQNYSEQDEYPQTDDIPITVPRRISRPSSKKRGSKPHIALRLPLQLLSFLLCIVLTVSLLGTALLMDLSRIFSSGGIKQLVTALFSVSQAKVPGPLAGAVGMGVKLDTAGDLEIPTDVLTSDNTEALVDWMLSVISESTGTEVDIDKEQLRQFVEQSTLSDYVAKKAAGYATDFINGTRNTLITSEELMELVEENEALIRSTFQVELTSEMKAELQTVLTQTIEDNRINEVIHEEVFSSIQESLNDALPVEWEQLQSILQFLTSDLVLYTALGLCLVLMLLLCLLNFYNIPGGLTWSAVACISAGALLSLPLFVLQSSPQLLTDLANVPAVVVHLILSFASVMSLVHYGMLICGVALLVLSILLRLIRASTRDGAPAAF